MKVVGGEKIKKKGETGTVVGQTYSLPEGQPPEKVSMFFFSVTRCKHTLCGWCRREEERGRREETEACGAVVERVEEGLMKKKKSAV